MYNRVRLTPEQRKRLIIDAAIDEALEKGLYSLSIVNVSRRLENCSRSLIKQYFRTLTGLKSEVIRHALDHEHHSYQTQILLLERYL